MKEDKSKQDGLDDLRRRAEELLRNGKINDVYKMSDADVRVLANELQVHQIELMMQNEELKRTRMELEDALKRYSDLYDFGPVGYFMLDKQGAISWASLTGAALLGMERADFFGKRFQLFVAPDERDTFHAFYNQLLESHVKQSLELTLLNIKDETRFYAHVEGISVYDSSRRLKHCQIAVIDVTACKKKEEEILLLHTLTFAISTAKDLHDALDITLEKVCHAIGWIYGEAWMPDKEGKCLERDHTFYSKVSGLEKFSELSQGYRFPPGVGLPGRAWLQKQPVWVSNITIDPNYPRSQIALECGLRTGVAFPVMAGDEVVAVLVFYLFESFERDEHLEGFVTSVTLQLGQVIKGKQAVGALKESHAHYEMLFETNPHPMWVVDQETLEFLAVNRAAINQYGYSRQEFLAMTIKDIRPPEDIPKLVDYLTLEKAGIEPDFAGVWKHRKKDGTIIDVEITRNSISFYGRKAFIVLAHDVTERRRMEEEKARLQEQLYHSRRLESIGRLAGGVAHEFNNMLMSIIGYGNLIFTEMKEDDPLRDYVRRILKSGERAADLTKTLLALGSKQVTAVKSINVNELIRENRGLLLGLMCEKIEFKIQLTGKDCVVMADNNQIVQALMNLATNAREAMPAGGALSISTDVVGMNTAFIKTHGYGREGVYVVLSVSDTGVGMNTETRERLFEPFFTTKEFGKSSGLGLALVYGIVKQHDGFIDVESEPGKGATFRIYLPLVETMSGEERTSVALSLGSEGTILVAEDDDDVRELVKKVFEGSGCTVVEAEDGEDAIVKFMDNKDAIQFLLFDVIMPKKNGKEAYDVIKKQKPDIKALFMSGYSEEVLRKKTLFDEGLDFIFKPVAPLELLKKVRDALTK
ncbi:MAG: PAS domain S-box protein [Planctomycetes bacterium]|nr:PAS domain S-box protein [Planctomycetota bacterium]